MAKVNYRQAKRQKELARKTRQEEKLLKRTARPSAPGDATGEADGPEGHPVDGAPAAPAEGAEGQG